MKKLHVLHTNDIHSHFEYWPQIHRFLVDKREEFEGQSDSVLVFDIGDHVDRSHAFTDATNGKGNIHLLNQANYDAVTIGNNEGITMSNEALAELYEKADFDVILSNLINKDGSELAWAVPSKIYRMKDGLTIGVVGGTAYYEEFYRVLGWKILPSKEQIIKEVTQLKDVCDVIICLSHLGIHEDRLLAAECPSIDLILGAHTHHILPEGEWIGETLLAATGKFGDYIGHVALDIDESTSTIIKQKACLYPSSRLPTLPKDVINIQSTLTEGSKALEEKVFYNPIDLKQNLFGDSELASFFGRALIDYTNADCALFNAGIFLSSLKKGWVTKEDLHHLLPHPINVCTIELTGEQLIDIYEQSLDEELPKIKVRGLGFRGTIMGKIIHERLYKNHRGKLFVGNREVQFNEVYRLATLDMFTFGFFFPLFKSLKKEYYMPDLIRDVFMKYGQK